MLLICASLPPVSWSALPTSALLAGPRKVVVCRVSVTQNLPHAPRLHALLTEAEQLRARRYHADADYHRFVIGRAALRLLLGRCLGQPPASLQFEPGPNQKPRLANASHLHYNVSHAGDWVLLAFGPVEVGIDLEKINPGFSFQELLSQHFSPAEQTFIARHPAPAAAFYQLWTRKEAFVKATAQGIDADFSQVPALDGRHRWSARHPSPVDSWAVSGFALATGYVAAVAYPVEVKTSQLAFYEVDSTLWP